VQRTKAYLYFAQSLCTIFESCVKEIEKNDFTVCELYPTMEQLHSKIESRLRDNFFSTGANKYYLPQNLQTLQMLSKIISVQHCRYHWTILINGFTPPTRLHLNYIKCH